MLDKSKLLFLITSLFLEVLSFGAYAATTENAVKAGFVYNFTKFIEWPDSTSIYTQFNLCVVGDNHLNESLQAIDGKMVKDRQLHLHLNVSNGNLRNCQMVFVAEDNQQAISTLLDAMSDTPIVTVSDSAGFVEKGGMIGLVRDGTRLSFEVNLNSANKVGIRISSKLLKLAKSVKGK